MPIRRFLIAPAALTLALAAAFPAQAQTAADVLKELEALKARIAELEGKLKAQAEAQAETTRELNRVTVKAEAMEDSRDSAGLKQLKISGYADPTFIWNRNQRRSGFQFLGGRDDNNAYSYDDSYFGSIFLDFLKETENGTRWRLSLMPNRGTDSVIGNGGVVHEASLSMPLGDLQTRLIAGHIPDWSGYEYLPAPQNKLITHNLLFDFTLPSAYTGVGLELTRGKWLMKGVVANMNAARQGADDSSPVFAYRVDYSKGEFSGFGFAGVHGKTANFSQALLDANGNPIAQKASRVDLFEVDGWFTRGDWTLGGQLSYGRQAKTAISLDASGNLQDATWYGASALAAYKFTPRWEGVARLDLLQNKKNGGGLLGYAAADDRNGIGPDPAGNPQIGANRTALSLGVNYTYDLNTTFKVEYRLDRASQPVFLDVGSGLYRKNNSLLGASVVVSF